MKKVLFLTLGIIVILAFAMTACGGNQTTQAPATSAPAATTGAPATSVAVPVKTTPAAGTPKYGGTLHFVGDTGPGATLGWAPEIFTAVTHWFVYNGLVKDWWDGRITPDLAESWEVDNSANPSITFKLRKGVKFHDGTELNADAVKFSYDGMIEAKKRPLWKSIEVIDEYTVKVNLTKYDNTILRSFESEVITSPTAFAKNGIEWMRKNPIGTGPFKFVKYDQDTLMVGEKNNDYWEAGKPYLDRIETVYIPDKTTKKAAMQSGQGDVALVELGKETFDYKAMKMFDVLDRPQATTFMIFDDLNKDSPFINQKVREAVAYAIDNEWIAKNLGFGEWKTTEQLPPRGNRSFEEGYTGRAHDVAKAKALLAEAGYPNGLQTQLLPNPEGVNRDIWVAIQSQLAEAGIKADLQFLEGAKYTDLRHGSGWQNAIVADTIPSWGNYNVSIDMMFGPEAVQFFPSMDKARDNWVSAINASKVADPVDLELLKKSLHVLYDNASVIPVNESGRCYVSKPYVKGAGFGERGAYFWAWAMEDVWLDK